MLVDSKRISEPDKWVNADISNHSFQNRLFTRLGAKKKKFTNVKFTYSIFDNCYLRNCVFDSCDFTGVKFIGCNLYESRFIGCTFNYCNFERTIIGNEILDVGCPAFENLKLRFARTLRMNFQQIGDAKSVNKAIGVELQATETHLFKAVWSNESYYRSKYRGFTRVVTFLEWADFKILDFIWGNGESALKLGRAVGLVFLIMAAIDVHFWGNPENVDSYISAFENIPQIFLGVLTPEHYPKTYITGITFTRLIAMGFFLSIIIKRFNRR
jgi:hypothetical protein